MKPRPQPRLRTGQRLCERFRPAGRQRLRDHAEDAAYQNDTQVLNVKIENRSDADFHVRNLSSYTLHANTGFLSIPAHAVTELKVKTLEEEASIELNFEVLNGVVAPKKHPVVSIPVKVKASH